MTIRIRQFNFQPGNLPAGPHNAITDVQGVRVGHVTLIEGEGPLRPGTGPVRTGITAVLPHGGSIFRQKAPAAVYTINGFGKACGFEQVRQLGQIETPILLTNTLNVGRAADALVGYMLRENPDIGIRTSTVNPLVGECNDGYLNDIQGRHVREEHVWQAIESASPGPVMEGCVGAGTGTACYGLKGGIGTASRQVILPNLDRQYQVGALLQTNFGALHELTIAGIPVGRHLRREMPKTGPGSVMIVLATDAPLDSRQLERLAQRAAFGLARTGTVCHHGSGDFVIAFSTSSLYPHEQIAVENIERLPDSLLDGFFAAVVESVEEAVYNTLVAAETMTGRDGHTLHALPHDLLHDLLRRYHRAEG